VIGPMPALFGNALCLYVISALAGRDLKPLSVSTGREKLYEKMRGRCRVRELQKFGADKSEAFALTLTDTCYVVDELFRGRSVLSGGKHRLAITRWDRSRPVARDNCIVVTEAEARVHDSLDGLHQVDEGVRVRVEALLREGV